MLFDGFIIGLASFLIIGLFHPLVIKGEYYFGIKIWPVFLVVGLILCVSSLIASNFIIRAILAVAGFSSLWSIKEIFEQRERVRKGWFPKNPKRNEE
ncbi:MAG: hypothetical protein H6Q17_947 [Bacteroidetes bacterium]|jgi:hypothetical protein|nr:hypothetical protein [Bacteroidota bacterium]